METKELKIQVPEGFEIDKKNSTFEKIIFKKIESKKWRNDTETQLGGYFIDLRSKIAYHSGYNTQYNYNLFANKKLAKSALAMARISQIMAYDKRFGGSITEEEWANGGIKSVISCSYSRVNLLYIEHACCIYSFLAFHNEEQAKLFLTENEDLIRDYFMIN